MIAVAIVLHKMPKSSNDRSKHRKDQQRGTAEVVEADFKTGGKLSYDKALDR